MVSRAKHSWTRPAQSESSENPNAETQLNEHKRRLKKDYQQTPRAIGVFLIRNNLNGKVFLAAGVDLPGLINRHKFQLKNGSHPNKQLQADWNESGSNNFAFEIVDELSPRAGDEIDYRAEVAFRRSLVREA